MDRTYKISDIIKSKQKIVVDDKDTNSIYEFVNNGGSWYVRAQDPRAIEINFDKGINGDHAFSGKDVCQHLKKVHKKGSKIMYDVDSKLTDVTKDLIME